MWMRRAWAIAPVLFLLGCSNKPKVLDDAALKSADQDNADWLMYGRTYDDHRFSPLTQINEQTVGRLGLAWSHELGTTRGLEATPLEEDGVIYTTGTWSVVDALDATTGEMKWTYDPKVPRERAYFICCDVVNRGVALYKGRVYVGTLDGRLIALDEKTGMPAWSVQTTDPSRPYAITSAPRIAKGMVVIGNAGNEYGVRGYVSAYDADTGKQQWITYTVPGDPSRHFESKEMETASKTWGPDYWKTGGGGSAWEGIVYDPSLDLLYFGTGNPTAWYRALRGSKGDALYTASIVALHASSGAYAWYFQTTPSDNWDYDATQPLMQADLNIGGKIRKVIMQANKNGFFYVLDRQTGEFISGAAFANGVTWARGLDPKTGRPIEAAGVAEAQPVITSPSPNGAHNWHPMAFNPNTGLVYLPVKSSSEFLHAPDAKWKYDSNKLNLGLDGSYDGPLNSKLGSMPPEQGELVAWDPVTQTAKWRKSYPTTEGGGVLATAGNLVFQGRADGTFAAYRASDGNPLWQFEAGTGIIAPPVTYSVNGEQYISLMVGWGGAPALFNGPGSGPVKPGYGRVLTFKLDGKATLKAPVYGRKRLPSEMLTVAASPQTVKQGGQLFNSNCAECHGINAVAGPLPDLRYVDKQTLEDLDAIVLGGDRATAGMPSFQKILTPAQVNAIQAYIAARARESVAEEVKAQREQIIESKRKRPAGSKKNQ